MQQPSRFERISGIGYNLVRLPIENYTLLRAISALLVRVVRMSNINKMSLRNIGMVFSPTLGIPAQLLTFFIVDFDALFNINDHGEPAP
ncbi:hypothetical protein GQ42DRAFT_125902, partial [Ramicandelaber brevisporus]